MKKIAIVLLSSLLLFCVGCGETPSPQQSTDVTEYEEDTPIYLELHFGNGEILRKDLDHLLVPMSSGGMDSSFIIEKVSYFGDPTLLYTSMWIYFTNERASYTTHSQPDEEAMQI